MASRGGARRARTRACNHQHPRDLRGRDGRRLLAGRLPAAQALLPQRGGRGVVVSYPAQQQYRPLSPSVSRSGESLADILERVLDKGVVIAGDIVINVLDIELLTLKLRLLIASADTAKEMGIDWWTNDPFLSGRAKDLESENKELRERLDRLERAIGTGGSNGSAGSAGSAKPETTEA